MFAWLEVLDSYRLAGRAPVRDQAEMHDWRSLALGFTTELRAADGRALGLRVDSFPLLYELWRGIYTLLKSGEFDVLVGEGWQIFGNQSSDALEIRIIIDLGDRSEVIMTKQISMDEAVLFLSTKLTDVVRSLENIGVDVEQYVSLYPLNEYSRIWQ